jgi:hypothetical protein
MQRNRIFSLKVGDLARQMVGKLILSIIYMGMGLLLMAAADCQTEAITNLNSVVGDAGKVYTWCDANGELETKKEWFNKHMSFGKVQWFMASLWSYDRINYGQTLIHRIHEISFLVFSVLANIFVLHFHYTNAPHPKYSLKPQSRISIRVHVISGTVGIILPLYVFFTTNESAAYGAMFACVLFDYIHDLTGLIQAPNVYGVRLITVPVYYVAILTKMIISTCLLQSLFVIPVGGHKTQIAWLWMVWTMHQTYAWVRVLYFILFRTNICQANTYTIANVLAAAFCYSYAIGFNFVLMSALAVGINYIVVDRQTEQLITKMDDMVRKDGRIDQALLEEAKLLATVFRETTFFTFDTNPEGAKRAIKYCEEQGIDLINPDVVAKVSDKVKAQVLFLSIDTERSGSITGEELEDFLMGFGVKVRLISRREFF